MTLKIGLVPIETTGGVQLQVNSNQILNMH